MSLFTDIQKDILSGINDKEVNSRLEDIKRFKASFDVPESESDLYDLLFNGKNNVYTGNLLGPITFSTLNLSGSNTITGNIADLKKLESIGWVIDTGNP